jgi:outer membrane protein assembly factor BamB
LGLKDNRYYNGVTERRTTTGCSALALIVASTTVGSAASAPPKTDTGPLALTPTRTVWTLALNAHLTQPPVYDDANGYFAIEGERLAAYDLRAATLLWIVTAKPSTALAAGGGLVFFVQDDLLTALHASDGSAAWTTPFPERVTVSPVWTAGWLIVATVGGSLHAFRANDGTPIWRHEVGAGAHAPPAISADRVYVSAENDRLVSLQIETGEQVWERRLGGPPNEVLAVDDRVFVGSTDHYLYCIAAADGSVVWRWRAGGEVAGLPSADDERVYFVSLDNVLRALNRGHGVQQWIQMLKLRPIGGPVKAGATIVVSGLQPPLRAFDQKDGKPGSDANVTGQVVAPPHVLGDDQTPALVVVTRDIAAGDTLTFITRSLDPAPTPFAAFPSALTTLPALAK